MSEDEGFLARWSRRKRSPDERVPEAAPLPKEPEADAAPRGADAPPPPKAEAAVAEVDLAKLPPLESITSGTDLRDFLAAGVPEALKCAALRRAWAADPAIRDFIGLSENAWDFTAPDGIHGFGPMLPTDDVAGMVAQVIGNMKLPEIQPFEADPPSAQKSPFAQEKSTVRSDTMDQTESIRETTECDDPGESNSPVARSPTGEERAGEDKTIDIAVQNNPTSMRRGHGGAVPK